jgi:hypothetical protein
MTLKYVYIIIFNVVLLSSPIVALLSPVTELSVDSKMISHPYSNRAIGKFTLQSMDALSHVYLVADRTLSRLYFPAGVMYRLILTGFLQNHYHPGILLGLAYHEFGHGSRATAYGYTVNYSISTNHESYQSNSYYELLSDLFWKASKLSSVHAHYTGRVDVAESVSLGDSNLIITAGGLNNEIYLAQLIENRFYQQKIRSVYDFFHYLKLKLAIQYYANFEQKNSNFQGDIFRLKQIYLNKDIDISYAEFKRYNGYALFLSSSFWAYLGGWSRYVSKGTDYVSSYEWHGIRLPDVNMYLTSHGVSYHVQSGIKYNDSLSFPLAIEIIFLGEKYVEFTLGTHIYWNDLLASYSEVRAGESLGFSQSIQYRLRTFYYLGIGLDWYAYDNLYGERHINSLKKGSSSYGLWFSISLRR